MGSVTVKNIFNIKFSGFSVNKEIMARAITSHMKKAKV